MALTLTPTLLHMALPWKAKSVLKKEVSKWSKGLHWSSRFIPLLWTQSNPVLDPAWCSLPGRIRCFSHTPAWCVVVLAPGLFREELQPQEVLTTFVSYDCTAFKHRLNGHGGQQAVAEQGLCTMQMSEESSLIQPCLPELCDTGHSFMLVLSGHSRDK